MLFLRFAGSTAAYGVKVLGMDPMAAVAMGMLAGTSAGVVNGLLTVGFGLPSFIATLGMYLYRQGARGLDRRGPAAHRIP